MSALSDNGNNTTLNQLSECRPYTSLIALNGTLLFLELKSLLLTDLYYIRFLHPPIERSLQDAERRRLGFDDRQPRREVQEAV